MSARGTNNRGREVSNTRARGRASRGSAPASSQSPQPSNMKVTPNTKIPAIYWEKRYSARTSRLIEWCKANDEARIKLFSDSAKDAKEEGRPRQQMSTQKKNHIQQLAAAIFTNDEDPTIRALYEEHPLSFIKPVESRFISYVYYHLVLDLVA